MNITAIVLSSDAVIRFLHEFEAVAAKEDFDLRLQLVHLHEHLSRFPAT